MDEKGKKQIPLRISAALYNGLCRMASDDFRSVNGEVEYLLTEAVKKRGLFKADEEERQNTQSASPGLEKEKTNTRER